MAQLWGDIITSCLGIGFFFISQQATLREGPNTGDPPSPCRDWRPQDGIIPQLGAFPISCPFLPILHHLQKFSNPELATLLLHPTTVSVSSQASFILAVIQSCHNSPHCQLIGNNYICIYAKNQWISHEGIFGGSVFPLAHYKHVKWRGQKMEAEPKTEGPI